MAFMGVRVVVWCGGEETSDVVPETGILCP